MIRARRLSYFPTARRGHIDLLCKHFFLSLTYSTNAGPLLSLLNVFVTISCCDVSYRLFSCNLPSQARKCDGGPQDGGDGGRRLVDVEFFAWASLKNSAFSLSSLSATGGQSPFENGGTASEGGCAVQIPQSLTVRIWTDGLCDYYAEDGRHQIVPMAVVVVDVDCRVYGVKPGGNCDPVGDVHGELVSQNCLFIAESVKEASEKLKARRSCQTSLGSLQLICTGLFVAVTLSLSLCVCCPVSCAILP